jgi:rubrerythrin
MVECEFPECTSFGTVIRFALELERVAAIANEELASEPGLAAQSATFKAIAENHRKRLRLLEDTRREKLNEMVLEPISDIKRESYPVDCDVPKGADARRAAAFSAKIEETSARFYLDSAKTAKNLLHDAARIMERLAKENMANKAKFDSL